MGRPPIEIDQEEFEKLCALQCTGEEIAGWFHVSVDTLNRWCKKTYKMNFAEISSEKREIGKISLRRRLFQSNQPSVLIFLAKNHLGMSDNPKMDENTAVLAKLEDIAEALNNASKSE